MSDKGDVKTNIPIFEKYNKLQRGIDHCNRLISDLKKMKDKNRYIAYCSDIQESLGEHLHKKISTKIILLIEGERMLLEEEQSRLRVDCTLTINKR